MSHDNEPQEPIVRMGTTFDIAGHTATVVGFAKDGVQCRVEGEKRVHTIPFAQIEEAAKQRDEEAAEEAA